MVGDTWISIKDNLPPTNVNIWAYRRVRAGKKHTDYVFFAYYDGKCWRYVSPNNQKPMLSEPDYWQHLREDESRPSLKLSGEDE
jgi:hypothetical protein